MASLRSSLDLNCRAPAKPSAPETPDVTPQIAENVRIPMAKMDALLRRAEEMIAVKLTTGRHAADLRALGSTFETWRKEWAKVRGLARPGAAGSAPAMTFNRLLTRP